MNRVASNIMKKLNVMQHKLSKSSLAGKEKSKKSFVFKMDNTHSSKDLMNLVNHSIDSHCSLTSNENAEIVRQSPY